MIKQHIDENKLWYIFTMQVMTHHKQVTNRSCNKLQVIGQVRRRNESSIKNNNDT